LEESYLECKKGVTGLARFNQESYWFIFQQTNAFANAVEAQLVSNTDYVNAIKAAMDRLFKCHNQLFVASELSHDQHIAAQ